MIGAVGLGVHFQTCRTLVWQKGLTDEQAIVLMVSLVKCRTRE